MTFLEFLKWLVETPEGITILTAKIMGIVAAVCLGVKTVRTAIVSTITELKNAFKGEKTKEKIK